MVRRTRADSHGMNSGLVSLLMTNLQLSFLAWSLRPWHHLFAKTLAVCHTLYTATYNHTECRCYNALCAVIIQC